MKKNVLKLALMGLAIGHQWGITSKMATPRVRAKPAVKARQLAKESMAAQENLTAPAPAAAREKMAAQENPIAQGARCRPAHPKHPLLA
jgi:hypothetical protein